MHMVLRSGFVRSLQKPGQLIMRRYDSSAVSVKCKDDLWAHSFSPLDRGDWKK